MSYFATKTRQKGRTENGREFLHSLNADMLENAKRFFSERIITNRKLIDAYSGIYTWILRASGNIYAAKIITKQEIGTLHANLDMLTTDIDSSPIIAAGEFIKTDDGTFQFNLLSGSYMAKDKFKKVRGESNSKYLERVLPTRNQLVTDVKAYLIPYGINFQFLECSAIECSLEELIGGKNIIETANIRTSNNNLARLNSFLIRTGGRTRRTNKRGKTRKMRSKE
jgi:hypothetical protein